MKVSVVIPALNEAANIQRAIESAWNAGVDEVIVADGGSQDETQAIVRKNSRAFLVETAAGRAKQQNVAAEASTGDILLFLHADNALSPGSISQLRAAIADPAVIYGAFRQRIDAPNRLFRLIEWGNGLRVTCLGLPFGDQAIFVRRETFFSVGMFPDEPLLEDVLLMKRLRRLARPVLLPGPVIVSPRRWQRHGIIHQTLRNWLILFANKCGVSPKRLASLYRAAEIQL